MVFAIPLYPILVEIPLLKKVNPPSIQLILHQAVIDVLAGSVRLPNKLSKQQFTVPCKGTGWLGDITLTVIIIISFTNNNNNNNNIIIIIIIIIMQLQDASIWILTRYSSIFRCCVGLVFFLLFNFSQSKVFILMSAPHPLHHLLAFALNPPHEVHF